MAVQDVLRVNPTAQLAQASRMVVNRFNDHPLFINPGATTESLMKKIQKFSSEIEKTENNFSNLNS
jgi:hypothetical protein